MEKKQPKMKVSNKQIGSPPEECFMHIAILHVGSVPVSLCPPTPQGPRVPPPSLVNRSTTVNWIVVMKIKMCCLWVKEELATHRTVGEIRVFCPMGVLGVFI